MRFSHFLQKAGRSLRGLLVGIAVVLGATRATAADEGVAPPSLAPVPEQKADGHRLHWTYPRFRLVEVIAAAAVTGTSLYLQYGIKGDFPSSGWDNGILLDDQIRDGLVAKSSRGREKAAQVSNYFWHITQYYPIIVDSLFVPLVTDKFNVDVAAQMALIDWQVEGLAFMLTRLSHRTVGRGRPSLQECDKDPKYDGYCSKESTGRTASFIGGHVSMSAAGAGLICAHHQALPLYGGNAADVAICGLAIASAATAGTLRVVADRHWASDIVVGALLGGSLGYGMPYLLHYRYGRMRPLGAEFLPKDTVLFPMVSTTDMGLAMSGRF